MSHATLHRGWCAALALALGLAITTTPLTAETVNGMTMTLPSAGWKKAAKGSIHTLQKEFPETKKEDRGAALIQIGKPITGTRTNLPAGMKAFVASLKEMAKEDPLIEHHGITVNGHDIRVEERCCVRMKGISVRQTVVGIANDTNHVYLQLIQMGLRDERSDEVEDTFEEIIRSLKMTPSDTAFEVVPGKGDGGLEGVFTYLDTGVRPNVFGGLDMYSDSVIRVFDKDGRYASELPKGGEDLAKHCSHTPTDCGLYRFSGGGFFSSGQVETREVTSDFGTFEKELRDFARDGDDIKIGERTYRAIPPFEEDATLDGTWTYTYASSGMTATSSGSVASSRTLELTPDGKFRRTGWHGASTTSNGAGMTTSGKRGAETGEYTLSGYRLDLKHADGKLESLSIFEPDIGSDELLVINGGNYLKQDD